MIATLQGNVKSDVVDAMSFLAISSRRMTTPMNCENNTLYLSSSLEFALFSIRELF